LKVDRFGDMESTGYRFHSSFDWSLH